MTLRVPGAPTSTTVRAEGSWWTKAPTREAFREAVESEVPRMSASREARRMTVRESFEEL